MGRDVLQAQFPYQAPCPVFPAQLDTMYQEQRALYAPQVNSNRGLGKLRAHIVQQAITVTLDTPIALVQL